MEHSSKQPEGTVHMQLQAGVGEHLMSENTSVHKYLGNTGSPGRAHLSVHPPTHPPKLSILLSVHPSTHPSIHPPTLPSTHPSIHASINPHSPTHPSTRPSIHLSKQNLTESHSVPSLGPGPRNTTAIKTQPLPLRLLVPSDRDVYWLIF